MTTSPKQSSNLLQDKETKNEANWYLDKHISDNDLGIWSYDLLEFILSHRYILFHNDDFKELRDKIYSKVDNLISYVRSDDFEMTKWDCYNEDETCVLLLSCREAILSYTWQLPLYCKVTYSLYEKYHNNTSSV